MKEDRGRGGGKGKEEVSPASGSRGTLTNRVRGS